MEYKDYYKIMGLARNATQDEIKRAHRKLARKYHPDISKEADAEARFKEVGEAYEVLKDPEKRAAYDQLGTNWQAGEAFHPPPNWQQGFEFHSSGFSGVDAAHFSDFFESLFGQAHGSDFTRGYGGHTQHGFNARGEDSYAKVLIDLQDAYQGATRTLTLKQTELDAQGHPQIKNHTLNVHIPKGVGQGQHIRLGKQGGRGIGKGEAGDLYLEIEFSLHPFYHAEGKDVYLELPVAPWEAALGATVKVPTPSGKVDLKIPADSANGGKLRLKGRGIPAQQPGDLYVVLKIALPKAESEASKAAYRVFEAAFKFNPRAQMGG